jgi:two-component system, chemotaxis family, sensor kinase CheA
MFITAKRHEREKQDLLGASNRLTDAILKNTEQGLFLLDGKDRIQPQVSQSLATLFRRQDFSNLSFEKLLAPVVTAKTLTVVRNHIAALLGALPREAAPSPDAAPARDAVAREPVVPREPVSREAAAESNPLKDIDVRLPNSDGTFESAHYSFEFDPIESAREPRMWLVRVTDITLRVQTARELEDLRAQMQTQGEILRGVLQSGRARFVAFLQRTDGSMKAINAVLKKPAREEDAFRNKLEETLHEVDRVRRDAAAFKLTALEGAARLFEDSLHDLRSRSSLSGSEFLPLAVKLDQLYNQFALLKSLTVSAGPARDGGAAAQAPSMTQNGTQIIEAPKFMAERSGMKNMPRVQRSAPAGSLDSTLLALSEHVAQEHGKTVLLECHGLQMVPPAYQAAIKNVAIQLIRNAVMHGIEAPASREAAGKPAQGTMRLEFKTTANNGFELLFEDDGCGLDPDKVRSTAIARGVVTAENAARMRDREAIKLIFKSGYTTLAKSPSDTTHGSGMSLVRRYVHEAGGRIALASLLGHETRFKVSFPPLQAAQPTLDLELA